MTDMTVLIDGDSIAYKAAACAHEDSLPFLYRQIDAEIAEILLACNTTNYELWIEDPINKDIFRNQIATSKPYKGHRKNANRPVYLLEAKNYMVKFWNARITSRYESEDMVICRAYQIGRENVIIAAIDKDLLMHPLKFYNYRTKTHSTISPEQGQINLWRQVCTGDSCDNIPGIPGVGVKRAARVSNMTGCIRMYQQYEQSYEYFVEQFNLIYIRDTVHDEVIYPVSKKEWEKHYKDNMEESI